MASSTPSPSAALQDATGRSHNETGHWRDTTVNTAAGQPAAAAWYGGAGSFPAAVCNGGAGSSLQWREGPPSSTLGGCAAAAPGLGSTALEHGSLKASRPLIHVLVINENHCGLTFLFEL
jgi:hypothetical protein